MLKLVSGMLCLALDIRCRQILREEPFLVLGILHGCIEWMLSTCGEGTQQLEVMLFALLKISATPAENWNFHVMVNFYILSFGFILLWKIFLVSYSSEIL